MNLAVLEPEQMAVRQLVVAEPREHDDAPISGSTTNRRLVIFIPLGTPELQVSSAVPLPERMPPSSRLQGVPHGTFTLLSKKTSS